MPSHETSTEYLDQVVRRMEFERAHPGVEIEHKKYPVGHWEARWTDDDDAAHFISVGDVRAHPLADLLDKLDKAFGDAP